MHHAGALLVYIHFLPHFKSLPEPPAADDDEVLLRSRDAATRDGLRQAHACMHQCCYHGYKHL